MGAGSKVLIRSRDSISEEAVVTNGQLHVLATVAAGGATQNVNIIEFLGVPVSGVNPILVETQTDSIVNVTGVQPNSTPFLVSNNVFPSGAVRDDLPLATKETDGDWIALITDEVGRLRVNAAAENEVQETGAVDLTLKALPLMALFETSPATTATDGQYSQLRCTNTGSLMVTINQGGSTPTLWTGANYFEGDTHISATSTGQGPLIPVRADPTTLTHIEGRYGRPVVDLNGVQWTRNWKSGSIINSGNSSTTPLAGGGNFTGSFVDLIGYTSVVVTVNTDGDSSTDGMIFEFSTDGANVDDAYVFTFTGDEARRFQFPVTARYFRVNFTAAAGGPGTQTFLRLQTILHTENVLAAVHRLGDDVSPNRSAQLVKSAIVAQTSGSGEFIPVQANSAGILKTTGGGETVTTDHFSGSTNGQPIQITATGTPGTLIHTADATNVDRVWVYITNTSTSEVTVTIEFGAAGAGNEIDMVIPPNDSLLVVPGAVLGGAAGQIVRAYASTGSVLNAFGRVETLEA